MTEDERKLIEVMRLDAQHWQRQLLIQKLGGREKKKKKKSTESL